jgi:hypothetical protein
LTKNDPEKAPSPVFVFCFFFRVVRDFRGQKCFAFGFPFACFFPIKTGIYFLLSQEGTSTRLPFRSVVELVLDPP